jgi:glycine betaine catabolism B
MSMKVQRPLINALHAYIRKPTTNYTAKTIKKMITFETEVIDIIDRAPGVKSFRFRPDERLDFKPGQFFFVGIMIEGVERTKHFSFSNSPTEKGYIEFTKRLTGSEFSNALNMLKPGDWAKIKAPTGNFTYEGRPEKVVFLSGGIGITPIRSMCKFAADNNLSSNIVVLYGNNTEADIIFKKDFDAMARSNKRLKIVYTLTSENIDKNTWNGRTGFIDGEMILDEVPDYAERTFYICGPPNMVSNLQEILRQDIRIRDDKIIAENFTGY